jgi:sugar/nucleoside kinase (ribokinase family)
MPRNDSRLSRFGNERVEQLAEEQIATETDAVDDVPAADAFLAGVVVAFGATPLGWAVLVFLTTGRSWPEAVAFITWKIAAAMVAHFELLVVVALGFTVFSVWLERKR